MFKVLLVAAVAMLGAPARATELSATETAWLQAALPVLSFARQQGLPLDIVVHRQAAPGDTPLGMAYRAGRCELVLSMRGNPEAQATLDRIEPSLIGPVVQAIAAHEMAHCWRHLHSTWGTLPEGMSADDGLERVSHEHAALLREMWTTRREEAYADLVGLAWTLQHHAARYEEVHAWIAHLRAAPALETGPHDTRKWVRLASDKAAFGPARSVFEQAGPLWKAGLAAASP